MSFLIGVGLLFFQAFVALVLTAPQGERPSVKAGDEPFSFDDIFDPGLRPRGFSPRWIGGQNAFLYRSPSEGSVIRYDVPTAAETILFDNTTFTTLATGTYFVSPDFNFALFAYGITAQWRHSYFAKYQILDISQNTLSDFPNGALSGQILQFAGWSSSGHSLSFVYGNNLYSQASPTDEPVQLTTDGNAHYIFNGVPDWLYEEDVISDRVSHYWSPDNAYICYARLDDTDVPLQTWPWYGPKTDVFGGIVQIAYPKAGDVRDGQAGPNTKVQLYVVNPADPSTVKLVPPPTSLASVDHYYLQVAWKDSTHLYVTWANRVQNESINAVYDVTATTLTPVENQNYEVVGGWVEVTPPPPWFIDDGERYLTIHPRTEDLDLGPWRHLAVMTAPATGPGVITFLTNGTQEIQYVAGYDDNLKVVYYVTTSGDPSERHIARVGLPEADAAYQEPVCLTCDSPDECRYISTSFSSTGLYYFVNCLGPDVPTYTLRSLVPGEEDQATLMENNDALRSRLADKILPTREFFSLPVGGGHMARGEIFLPGDYTPGEVLPVLVYVYAGPGSQRVMKTFPLGSSTNQWLTYLKSSVRVAVASVDGRGSMADGDKLKFEMYRKLATVEVEDQILGGAYLQLLSYIDNTRPLAMFGWSYGGGTTAHVIGNQSEIFRCGISVAPVTTKTYYDTAYTERYLALATPDDNEEGYDNTDVMRKSANFKSKQFMIAHGTADDNVHYMHTVQLINALANEDVMFRQNLYMDQNHGINSPGQSRHLYHSMTQFLVNDCWEGTLPMPGVGAQKSSGAGGGFRLTSSAWILVAFAVLSLFQAF